MLTTAQATKKYGAPNETGAGYLVSLNLPYPMRLAWDKDTTVKQNEMSQVSICKV
jgi:hypothetical protein